LIVRLLARFGLAENLDPAGGYVYRFSRREIHKILSSVQTVPRWRVHTAWMPFGSDALKYFPIVRRCIYPVINNSSILRMLTSKSGKRILKALFDGLNFLIGRWGNCLILVAWKQPQ
jgi:hypothetical protein